MKTKKIYTQPTLSTFVLYTEDAIQEEMRMGSDIESNQDFAKGGTGSFEWDDFGEEEDLLDEDQF